MMLTQKKVIVDENDLNGNPYLEGTKLTVFDIVSECRHEGFSDFLETSQKVTADDLKYVFEYCKKRQCDRDQSHCGGCSLRAEQDGIDSKEDFINRFAEVRFVESDEVIRGGGEGIMIMPEAPDQLCHTWRGEDGWLIASDLLDSLMESKYLGMTVNERLYASGLFEEFDKAVEEKRLDDVIRILKDVELNAESIEPILEQFNLKA